MRQVAGTLIVLLAIGTAARSQGETSDAGRVIRLAVEALSQCETRTAYTFALASVWPPHEIVAASQQACLGQIGILRHALIASGMEESLADGAIGAEEKATETDLISAINQWRAAATSGQ
jgi:hypothetical protein